MNGFLSEDQVGELVEALNRHSEAMKDLAEAIEFHSDTLEYSVRKRKDRGL